MNAKLLCPTLLALSILASSASAQVRHTPDVDVYQAIAALAPEPLELVRFDADWTADGRLAIAFVERRELPQQDWAEDQLTIALHDPLSGDTRVLAEFPGYLWMFDSVSLAVPDEFYGLPDPKNPDGPGIPLHDLNNVHVAIGARMPVWGEKYKAAFGGSYYHYEVRVVRLLSVSFTSPSPKLGISVPADTDSGPVVFGKPYPNPKVSVASQQKGYCLDLAFVHPQLYWGAQASVWMCRSFDQGKTLEQPYPVTGPKSLAAAISSDHPLAGDDYHVADTCSDRANGLSVLALQGGKGNRIRIVTGEPGTQAFDLLYEVPNHQISYGRYAPRIAADGGWISLTCLTVDYDPDTSPLDWFTGAVGHGFWQNPRITDKALTPGSIQVRGQEALVATFVDQGWAESGVLAHRADRLNQYAQPLQDYVDDDGEGTGAAIAAMGTMPGAVVFLARSSKSGDETVRMDQ